MTTEESEFPLWDDNPTDIDLLGFASLVQPARQALTRPTLDPVCVGVLGPWGSGKTSVAHQIQTELGAQPAVLVVYAELRLAPATVGPARASAAWRRAKHQGW